MKMREHHVDGHTAECVNDCAWLVDDACSNDNPRRMCAVTALVEALGGIADVLLLHEYAGELSVFQAVNDRRDDDQD